MTGLLVVGAEVDGRRRDIRVEGNRIVAVADRLPPRRGESVLAAEGGALLPGLHDHHLHLLALAAAADSVLCGPPSVHSPEDLQAALQRAGDGLPAGAWLRGTGYTGRVAGNLDRDRLDRMLSDRPLRVQHRSGGLWILNSAALTALDLDRVRDPDVERDTQGRLTGRLWRWDGPLRRLLPSARPDLAPVGRRLARLGITGVTDATPDLDDATVSLLTWAAATRVLPPELVLLGAPDGSAPRKLLLRDHDLPTLDELTADVRATHAQGRPVAVHCVTRVSLLLTLAALKEAGPLAGDRIEHGAVIPPQVRPELRRLGIRVVTQPAFVQDRGDDYRQDVDPDDLDCLYPYASLLQAGVPVAPSSDAPFGELDPWQIVAAARDRRTRSGVTLSAGERVPASTALAGYLSPPTDPGGPARRIYPGATADLCLLDAPLGVALAEPSADRVRTVLWSGKVSYDR